MPNVAGRAGIIPRLESYFEFERFRTTWKTEFQAGATTFMTMAYIIFVNPSILKETGMQFEAVAAATCLCAALGSILMGVFARIPLALAPGMGLNAYFTYSVVLGMGVPWQTALGAVFLSGVAFLILALAGAQQWIVGAIPQHLYAAVAAGIGLFIAMIGLRNAGIIVANPSTMVALGNLRDPNTLLAIFGLLLIAALLARGVPAAMLAGILATTLVGVLLGLVKQPTGGYSATAMAATAGKLDIPAALHIGLLDIVFVFLFVDVFDNVGTLVGVAKRAGLMDAEGNIPRLRNILVTDSVATMAGAFAGTSTVTSYIESASGVVAGGRTGVTAIVTGALFVCALFCAPLTGAVPAAATAPALIVVGSLMLTHIGEIPWRDASIAIPAFLTLITIPLTFSIANGLAFGFTAYALLRIARGEFRATHWLVYLLAALFIARFIYLGSA